MCGINSESKTKGASAWCLGGNVPVKVGGKVRNVDLRNMYSSPHGMRMVELRRMTSVGHVARLGEKINTSRVLVGRSGEMNIVGDADVVVFVICAYEMAAY